MEDQPRPALPAWRTCLDIEAQSAEHYLDHWNAPLLEMVEQPPRRVLELGCAAGMFGAKLKEKFPGTHVTGVEAGHAAAHKAATRLDRVIRSRLEELDFLVEGLQPGEFDLVIAADILEHLVNPWEFLVRLRPYLGPSGVLLSSMPNVRNLNLVMDLVVNGRWRYAERGILDVTHVRFFTLEEMRLMFVETGYAPQGFTAIFSPSLVEAWEKYQGAERLNLSSGRVTIEGVSRAELAELCAEQFLMRSVAA